MSGIAKSEPQPKAPVTAVARGGPYDVVVIGVGLSGMYQLHRLRGLGLSARVFEAGDGVGGTWYWNRYPGARFDSESWTYGYSFSDELLREWEWSEHFAAQPETLRYCNFVADKLDLRRDIEFNHRIKAVAYDEPANQWEIESEDGRRARARFLVTAIGPLSAPTMPTIPGVESFRGESYHTGTWPHRPVSFAGKRVAVIGTGATGVQAITEIAKTVGHLTVFQRTPNWCAPLHNSAIDAATQARIKATYGEIFAVCRDSFGCFIHQADPRNALDVSPEVREAFYEKRYGEPGFGIWMGNFRDVLIDKDANATITEFMRRKIRERVRDPEVAEKLIPTNHGFGTRRVPLESGYYEVFNQANVRLVDLRETPDRADHARRHQDRRRRKRVRHDHLRHRLRRHHRVVRPHRRPRPWRPAAEGQVVGRAAHLSRPADRGLPQPVHAGRAPQRGDLLQHPARHRAERRLGDRAHRPCARRATPASRLPPRRSAAGPSTCTTLAGGCCSRRSIPG